MRFNSMLCAISETQLAIEFCVLDFSLVDPMGVRMSSAGERGELCAIMAEEAVEVAIVTPELDDIGPDPLIR